MNDHPLHQPTHIGFIVDGNRRWARSRGQATSFGHKKGFDVLWDMAYQAQKRNIKYVSAFIFSTENWSRSSEEVGYLMDLFYFAFKHRMKQMIADNFRIIFLGRRDNLDKPLLSAISETEEKSQHNTGTTLALCFNYGGHAEIVDAIKAISAKVASGSLMADRVDEIVVRDHLYHPELPDVDLMIRTSGEERLSGFQLWRMAYSELLFLDKMWPDFNETDLDECLVEFSRRHRRFGK